MLYNPPIGGASNDPYVDANPAGGVQGSPVPAAAIEHPMREIINVITAAGLTPNAADLTQLKQAIQRIATGGDYKESCRVATTANLAALSGLPTIDGVVLVAGDRVLVKDQTTGSQNGIYLAAAGAWSRATDADDGTKLSPGASVPVETGTANADTIWLLTTDGAITIGTTALTWQIKSGDASTTRKGQVQLTTSAEAQALTDAFKALTPATLVAALQGGNQSLAANGYQKLPGGLIIQWGYSTAGQTETVVTFPVAFPTACRSIVLGNYGLSSTSTEPIACRIISTTQFGISSTLNGDAAYWFAIGH